MGDRERMWSSMIPEHIAKQIAIGGEDECWPWTGALRKGNLSDGGGYARTRIGGRGGRNVYIHRLVYEEAYGAIPEGLVIDHLCRTRECCNPAHLEAVTIKENNLRGNAPSIVLHRSGKCSNGHDLKHSYVRRDGRRNGCPICAQGECSDCGRITKGNGQRCLSCAARARSFDPNYTGAVRARVTGPGCGV